MAETYAVTIDGREVELPKGSYLLTGALEAGIYIPHLCFHRDLPPARDARPAEAIYRGGERIEGDGSEGESGCGLCVVEVEGETEPAPSCALEVSAGMVVRTTGTDLEELRRQRLADILAHHPHACVTCAQKEGCSREPCSTSVPVVERCCPLLGRCELEKLATYIGVPGDTPRYVPRGLESESFGELYVFDAELCVACLRCVRVCADVKGVEALGFVYRDGDKVVGRIGPTDRETECRFCGACVEICPTGALLDREAGSGAREEWLVPCQSSCPAGVDVPRFLRAVAGGRLEEGARVSLDRLPLPNVLGRVCFHPCEDGCRRAEFGGPLSVCRLRRHVFDRVGVSEDVWPTNGDGSRVAIIGSGPAGLAAAHFLRRLGRGVTIFEAEPEAGGLLRYGIPEYRLPRATLDKDLQLLTRQGIEIRTDSALGRDWVLDDLREQGYSALILAAGAGAAKNLRIPGSDLGGVLAGVGFLHDVADGVVPTTEVVDRTVLVIGGGNVAVDAARSALRLGAASVTMACLEAADEMPAYPEEVEAAQSEGIEILRSWGANRLLGDGERVCAVHFVRCVSVFDDSGRFAPTLDPETTREIAADTVIVAIGQEVEPDLRQLPGLEFGTDGFLRVEIEKPTAGAADVFACGDLALGPSSVVRAVASGRRTAEAVDRYLGGAGEIPSILEPEEPDQWIGPDDGFASRTRAQPDIAPAATRIGGFAEVESTLESVRALKEAGRCLQCDLRLRISAPFLPPPPWLELTEEEVAKIPAIEGVYQLLGDDWVATKIVGTADLARALREELTADSPAPRFVWESDPMYTKRESELIQQFLAVHGRMPSGGDDDLDDLF